MELSGIALALPEFALFFGSPASFDFDVGGFLPRRAKSIFPSGRRAPTGPPEVACWYDCKEVLPVDTLAWISQMEFNPFINAPYWNGTTVRPLADVVN